MRALFTILLLLPAAPTVPAGALRHFVPNSYAVTLTFRSQPGMVHDPSPGPHSSTPTYPGLASVETTVRWDGHKFHDAGGRFREDSRWIVPVPAGYSTFAQRTASPLPGTTVYDGHVLALYDPAARTAALYSEDVSWPSTEDILRHLEQFASPQQLVAHIGEIEAFRTAKLLGRGQIAGRPVYVVALSQRSRPIAPDDHDWPSLYDGRLTVWLDAATFFTLREDQYAYGSPHQLLLRMQVTSIRYNVKLPSSLFRVTVPPGYKVVHRA